MAEYIEREAALKRVDTAIAEYARHGEIVRFIGDCRASVIYTPAADVVEVQHRAWLPQLVSGERAWVCNGCKTLGSPRWIWCPVCGAKMDGKDDSK